MMLTVSPVPFKVTFTGRDAIIANTYSKSALRAAAETFVYRHDNVDYLPSYEIVTHTARASAYIQDNRHITPSAVNEIVDRVVSAYCPNLAGLSHVDEEGRRSASMLREALQKGDMATASRIFAKISNGHRYLRWGYTEATYRLSYGKTLAKLESLADAQAHLSKAVALEPQNSDAQFNLGLVLAKLQRSLEAEAHLGLAVSLHPKSPEYRLRYARQLFANGKAEAAATELQIASEQHPRHQRITDFHLAVMASLKEKAANAKAADDSVADEALAEPQNETALQGRAKVAT
jgi:tetratricopeptide (TPR) repeat protein